MGVEIAARIGDGAVASYREDPAVAVVATAVVADHRRKGALDQGDGVRVPAAPGRQRVGMDLAGLRHQTHGNAGQTPAGQRQALLETAVLGVEAGSRPQRKSRIDRPIDEGSRRWFEVVPTWRRSLRPSYRAVIVSATRSDGMATTLAESGSPSRGVSSRPVTGENTNIS